MATKKPKNSSKSSSTTKKNNKSIKQDNKNMTTSKETTFSPTPKKKRVTLNIFGKKFLLGMALCTFSAAAGAGIAYGTIVAINASNNSATATTNTVRLYGDGGNPISMTVGATTPQTFNVPEDNWPTINNYKSSNANYLTLSLIFSSLEFTFTNETEIPKDNISFTLVLISDVTNASPTTLTFSLSHDAITVPAGKTLSFTNLVFDFKVDVATNGSISLTKSTTENSTLKVGKISVK